MHKALLAGEVMDVLYYTHMLARNTLMASGDATFEEYLVLLDAALRKVSTPKELARLLNVNTSRLTQAAESCEVAGFLQRTRSPLDRRLPGYTATAEGRRKALVLNKLLMTVACDFWRTDEAGVRTLVATVEPFQLSSPIQWPESPEAPISLRSLCALFRLWTDYRHFSAQFWLSFSEMHMLTITYQFGPQPNHPLYRDRNMFASNDYAANVMLTTEKGLMKNDGQHFQLTSSGRKKVEAMIAACDTATPQREIDEKEPLSKLHQLCLAMTTHAMANGTDLYRGTQE